MKSGTRQFLKSPPVPALKPFPMLGIDEDVRSLAEKIIAGRGIPTEYPEDALHIAVAAVNGAAIFQRALFMTGTDLGK